MRVANLIFQGDLLNAALHRKVAADHRKAKNIELQVAPNFGDLAFSAIQAQGETFGCFVGDGQCSGTIAVINHQCAARHCGSRGGLSNLQS